MASSFAFPAWPDLKSLATATCSTPSTKRAYAHALEDFHKWHADSGCSWPMLSIASVSSYRDWLKERGISSSSINVRLSAIRHLALRCADEDLISETLAARIRHRAGFVPRLGVRTGNWLNELQAEALLDAPNPRTLTGKRDRAILGLLLGCGLRRSELARLDLMQVRLQDGRWVVADILGKCGRIRTVPMAEWTKARLDDWIDAAGLSTGRLFRTINRGGRVGGQIQRLGRAIYVAVRKYCSLTGIPDLSAVDLRRTFAKLALTHGAELEQIQLSLGHASLQSTQIYLGVRQSLKDAPCDHLGLNMK